MNASQRDRLGWENAHPGYQQHRRARMQQHNFNDYVEVVLTPWGVEVFQKYVNSLGFFGYGDRHRVVGRKHKFQLWQAMYIFGPEMTMTARSCFENNTFCIFSTEHGERKQHGDPNNSKAATSGNAKQTKRVSRTG